MPLPAPLFRLSVSTSSAIALLGAGAASAQVQQPPSAGDRVLGLDVSAWQGNWSQTLWNNIRNVENRQFVFIRSSRGGTSGYYNQSDPNNVNGQNTFSQRYDDPYFVQNITSATNAGMLAGSYHFSRPDIIEGTLNSGGIRNNGTDEANHFIQMAGAWMRPGYLLPVHDLEAGINQRTSDEMAQFAIDFSNRIYQVMGIRPVIYLNGSYANDLQNASTTLRNEVIATHPTLWSARWPAGSGNQYFGDVQTEHPKDTYDPIYGPWDNSGNTHPWAFWQYASGGRLQSYNNGGSNLDFNVAQGNIEFLKDQQVPALWTNAGDGNWATMSNWNSGQAPVAPVQGPGQVARVGSLTLPAARMPGLQDNVSLNRPNENITITLDRGFQSVRRFNLNERLNVSNGALVASLSGQVGAGGTLSLSGGNVTFGEGYVNNGGVLDFSGAGTLHVGKLFLSGNPTFTGTSGTGQILAQTGAVNPALDLMNGTRSFTVDDGSASSDMRIALPLTNGHLTKDGPGTLELTGNNSAYAGTLLINGGNLRLTSAEQIGTAGVGTGTGGSVQLDGNGLNVNRQIRLGGRGANGAGALQNVSGNNTWSGNVVLNGTQNNHSDTGMNQISAAAGTTLTVSGVMQNGTGTSWNKGGAGDVVLGGASPNTYTNLTRIFEGRLIIEKNGALGTADQTQVAANTVQLAGGNSVIGFRAPGASAGLNYTTAEWIFTEGLGVNNVQIDNLGGANTFAGHVGLGGPVGAGGVQEASIGVSAGSLDIKGGLHARTMAGPEARNIAKRGAGTLILSGSNVAPPTNNFARSLASGSTFTVEAGTVQLKGTATNGVNVAGVDTWKVNSGALLSLSQGGVAGSADVQFNGGTLRAERSMVAANSLTFAGNGTIDTAVPVASINAMFTGSTSGNGRFTKRGAGNVVLAGAVNNYSGFLTVNGGTLGIGQNGTDTGVANISGLAIAAGATFDLADNDLIIRAGSLTIEGYIAAGFNGGDWNGTGGIISSTARDNDWIYTLGVADNAQLNYPTSFGGHPPPSAAATLVKYTIVGDADLSGVVNAADFARFRAGFANEMPDAWLFGDFNYSGVVDGLDFELYLRGFLNQPGSQLSSSFANQLTTFAVENGFDPTMVPEPANLALLALGAGMLMRRRRCR